MNRASALHIASVYNIDLTADFHALTSSEVDRVLTAAKFFRYRKPTSASGSKARYFFAKLVRAIR